MKLALGSDHAGFELKQSLEHWAIQRGIEIVDFGAQKPEPCDYPTVASAVAEALRNGTADCGVLCCGTGIGMSIAANRFHGIRAALCCSPEMAELARSHNQANILCIGSRMTTHEQAETILERFLATKASRDERHLRRVEMLDNIG